MTTKSNVPSEYCRATKEDLLIDNILKVWDVCPLCAEFSVQCYVGSHPIVIPMTTWGNLIFLFIPNTCILILNCSFLIFEKFLRLRTQIANRIALG